MLWRILWRVNPALLALLVACSSTPHAVRVEQRQHSVLLHLPRTTHVQPIPLDEEEFRHAVRQLAREVRLTGSPRQFAQAPFQLDPLSGNYLYLRDEQKLVPTGDGHPLEGSLSELDLETAERYRLWCQRVYGLYGDCLGGALVAGRYLDVHGRYVWALALSKSPVLDELRLALGDMVQVRALISAALWTLAAMLLVMALNPVVPGLVAILGVAALLYVGYDTLYNLVTGWSRLKEEVKDASSFEQIRDAGERFGKLLGRQAARAFALLLMAAIGSTAHQFAAKVPTLPGSAQLAVQSQGQARFSVSSLGSVEELALSAEGATIAVASTAVTMAARGQGGNTPCVEQHHIATICNDKSTARGGPWTPRFREIFAKAGMKLDDPANKVPTPGHKGPHPERYHEIVHEQLVEATESCRTVVDCRLALTRALRHLAKEITTPGTELNQLVTRRKAR